MYCVLPVMSCPSRIWSCASQVASLDNPCTEVGTAKAGALPRTWSVSEICALSTTAVPVPEGSVANGYPAGFALLGRPSEPIGVVSPWLLTLKPPPV